MTVIEYSKLPPPAIVEALDFEALFERRKARLIELYPEDERAAIAQTLTLESEPIVKLLQENAYEELLLRQRINEAARANLIQFAVGSDLDQLAAFYELARLPDESDARFRLRLQLAIAALAGNGTAEHYRGRALGVSLQIIDANVTQPWPGTVQVAIWVADGADSAALLAQTTDTLTAPDKKILGVAVGVVLARPRVIDITATIRRTSSAPADLAQQLTAEIHRVLTTAATMGRAIPRSWIIARLHVDGVASVDLLAPSADVPLDSDEYPTPGQITISDGGVL